MTNERDALRVFISYARRDAAEFAEELLSGLELLGFEAILDRHDIAAGEDWEARLGGLIQAADTIVFVMSPASIASERCRWEMDRAAALSKRLIPVVWLGVAEAHTPDTLKRLNYIFFSEGHSFSKGLGALANALRVDLDWIREHTRLGDIASRWDGRDKSDALLLRGAELAAAREWLAAWRTPAPEPTDLQRTFIGASESAEGAIVRRERARQRRLIAVLSVAALIFASLSIGSALLWQRANAALNRANAAAEKARVTTAQAHLYEGLYWLRVSRTDAEQRQDLIKAERALAQGERDLGTKDAVVDGQSLRGLLHYARRYVRYSLNLTDNEVSPPNVHAYYCALRLAECSATPVQQPAQ